MSLISIIPDRLVAAEQLRAAAFPTWFTGVAVVFLIVGVGCAVLVAVDVVRRPQRMAVMNVVWPVTMLFAGMTGLLFYGRFGRAAAPGRAVSGSRPGGMAVSVATGASHCGAGCAIGDLVGEFALVLFPGIAVALGWGGWYQDRIFAGWILDFVLAFGLGIVFQYFAIAPMRGLGSWPSVWAAVKADTFSIAAWQVGMYAVMAAAQFWLLPAWFGGRASVLSPQFWFVMQLAMLAGFATSYPVNWLLIRIGVKERM